jgi:acetyl esterase/lipase
VKAAVRWLRANSADFGLDPARFGAIGFSAGGYLAAMIGTNGGLIFSGDAALGNADISGVVQAVVVLYGPSNFATMDDQLRATPGCGERAATHDASDSPESRFLGRQLTQAPDLVRAASPITYLSQAPTLPPFLVEHGAADCIVPAGQSRELAAAITASGGVAKLTIVPGAGHGGGYPLDSRLPSIVAFLDQALGG